MATRKTGKEKATEVQAALTPELEELAAMLPQLKALSEIADKVGDLVNGVGHATAPRREISIKKFTGPDERKTVRVYPEVWDRWKQFCGMFPACNEKDLMGTALFEFINSYSLECSSINTDVECNLAKTLLPATQYQKDKELVEKVMWEATKRNVDWVNSEVLKQFNVENKTVHDARIYVAMIDKFPELLQNTKQEVLAKYKELPEKNRPVLQEPGFIFDGFSDDEQHEAARMERFMLDVDKLVCDLINNPDNTHFQSWKKFSKKFGRVERTKLLLDRVNQLLPILQEELGCY